MPATQSCTSSPWAESYPCSLCEALVQEIIILGTMSDPNFCNVLCFELLILFRVASEVVNLLWELIIPLSFKFQILFNDSLNHKGLGSHVRPLGGPHTLYPCAKNAKPEIRVFWAFLGTPLQLGSPPITKMSPWTLPNGQGGLFSRLEGVFPPFLPLFCHIHVRDVDLCVYQKCNQFCLANI